MRVQASDARNMKRVRTDVKLMINIKLIFNRGSVDNMKLNHFLLNGYTHVLVEVLFAET